MKDPEVIQLRNRFILGIIIIIIFLIPLLIFISNKSGASDSIIINKINNKEKLFIFITSNNCSNCKEIEKIIKNEKIDYIELNKDKIKNYNYILKKIDISEEEITIPSLIYEENGKNYAILTNIKEEELIDFIDNYK